MKIVLILTLLVLTVSCKKDYTITGKIGCNTPLANQEVTIRVGGAMYGERFKGVTDSNGKFTISYSAKKGSLIHLVNYLGDIPAGTKDIGTVGSGLVHYSIIYINALNPLTVNDTLFLSAYDVGVNLQIPGPFVSGVIDTFWVGNPNLEEEDIKFGVPYSFSIPAAIIKNGVGSTIYSSRYPVEYCSTELHSTYITIE